MNLAHLRAVQNFIEALNELANIPGAGLHLYGYADVFIDDASSNTLCKLSYDSEDGYSIEPA